jgi:SAM-dependent methyltransferase
VPDYGNWVGQRFVVPPLILGLVLAAVAAAVLLTGLVWLFGLLLAAAVVVLVVAAYFAWARHLLSPAGGDVQARLQVLVVQYLDWDGWGRAIDIGCGNGPLAVAVAQSFPDSYVTGVDFWGKSWEYSQRMCEENAALEGVGARLDFVKASASALPFPDGAFDAAVSNLCFHEVRDARDKREVVREALRVVKPGGAFAFQDLFGLKGAYGEIDDLLATIRGWGVARVEFADTSASEFIPGALRLPFMVGTIGMLHGVR